MNVAGAVAGNPRLYHLKTAMFSTIFNAPFQKQSRYRIELPCLLCMLPLLGSCYVRTLVRSKNPMEPP